MSTGKIGILKFSKILQYWKFTGFQFSNISQYSNISSVNIRILGFSRITIFTEFFGILKKILEYWNFLGIEYFNFPTCIFEFSRIPIFQYSNMSSKNIVICNIPIFPLDMVEDMDFFRIPWDSNIFSGNNGIL